MSRHAPTIAVIGGGFSGTALAAHLLRRGRPGRILLINRFGPMGRGVAYGTSLEAHVLNVPAGGMSALPEDRDHFVRWARTRDDSIRNETFVSRRVYGEYLEAFLLEAEHHTPHAARLERLVAVARDIEARPDGDSAEVVFAGARIGANAVVLALGNYSPSNPAAVGGAEFYDTPRYVRDPWVRGSLDVVRPGESVLMLGTGLTMMDIALDLARRGVKLPLFAVSRHGLLPREHRERAADVPEPLPSGFDGPPRSVARYARLLRRHVAERAAAGGDWRDAVAAVRAIAPALWMGLTQEERARFLRHLRPWWDVHRHRAAPATAKAIERLLVSGDLSVRAARVLGYRPVANEVEVTLRPRGGSEVVRVHVDRVVNCTGPSTDVRRVGDPLLDALLARKLMRPDPLGLGVETAADGALLDASGRPSRVLYLVGPLLKADYWEATAVPELRRHAARLAERLLP
jgi:uncharacterized NAD(P)/FAD-binding protein YdhS